MKEASESDLKKEVVERVREKIKLIIPEKKPHFNMNVIYALGSGAGNILAKLDLPPQCLKVAINSNLRDLMAIHKDVDIIIPCGSGRGSGMDPEQGKKDFMEVMDYLPMISELVSEMAGIKQPDIIPVIATPGHGFGSGSALPACDVLRRSFPNSILMPILTSPFKLEGERVIERAWKTFKELCENDFTILPISNEIVAQRLGIKTEHLPLTRVYEDINSKISNILSTLVSALSATEGIISSFDVSDLRRIYKGNIAIITYAEFPRGEAINLQEIKRAEGEEWFKSKKIRKIRIATKKLTGTFIVYGRGANKLTLEQMTILNNYLTKKYNIDTGLLKPLIVEHVINKCYLMLLKCNYELSDEMEFCAKY